MSWCACQWSWCAWTYRTLILLRLWPSIETLYLSCQQSIMSTIHASMHYCCHMVHQRSLTQYHIQALYPTSCVLNISFFFEGRFTDSVIPFTVYHLKDKSNCFPQTPALSSLSQWTNHWTLMNKPTNHVSVATYIYFHCYHYWSSCVIVKLDCMLLSLLKRTLFFQNPPDLIRFHFYCYFQLLFGRKRYFAKS